MGFLNSKENKSGYGKLIPEKMANSSIGNVVELFIKMEC